MGRTHWRWILSFVVIVTVVGIFFAVHAPETIKWVGFTHLDITFNVTDEEGMPVSEAEITILGSKSGGLCEPDKEESFVLKTDAKGAATATRQCMCFGTLRPGVDSFISHMPEWSFRVSAKGFRTTQWLDLYDFRKARRAVEGRNESASLEVSVRLARAGTRPG